MNLARVMTAVAAWALSLAGSAMGQPTTVTACAHPAAQPMSWEHQGRMHGVCVEVAQRAFASAGLALQVQAVGPWSRCQALVERGQVDVMVCAFDTPARRAYAQPLEPPLASNESALFVRRDSGVRFESWADLQGLRIGVGHGVSLGTEIDRQLAAYAQVDNALSEELNLRKLLLGRLDAVATAREAGEALLRSIGCDQAVRALPRSLGAAPLHLQVSRHSPTLGSLPALRTYLQRAGYAAELSQLHRQQAELYRRQNPPRGAEPCGR